MHPDLGQQFPPLATLVGLALKDSLGQPAQMAWFTPRSSSYFASVSQAALAVRLVATANDPDAELDWRLNGGKWDFLVSGLTSAPVSLSAHGWTLLEVRVRSTAAAVEEPLVYQIAVTKDVVCHPRCRLCDGPAPNQCTACFAPLLLYKGKCVYTRCEAKDAYFDADKERCAPCDPTCLECSSGSPRGCTACPKARFLLTTSIVEVAGRCIAACPFGYFVRPVSQSCQRARADTRLEKFYYRLDLRIPPYEYLERTDLPPRLLQVAVETLKVSSQGVRFVKWEPEIYGFGIRFYIEVESPFLYADGANNMITIDEWFAAMPVPVDRVVLLSYGQMHPAAPLTKPEPLLKPWIWGAIAGGVTGCLILFPLYHFYFVRKYWQSTAYRSSREKDQLFVQGVMAAAREQDIVKANKMAHRLQ